MMEVERLYKWAEKRRPEARSCWDAVREMRTNAAVRNGSKGGIRNVQGVRKERMRSKRRQRDANRRQRERRTNGLRSLHEHGNSRQTNDETTARQQTAMINAPCPSRRRGAGLRSRGEEVKSSKTRGGAHYTRHVGGQLRPLLRPALPSACQALLWLLRLPSWALN